MHIHKESNFGPASDFINVAKLIQAATELETAGANFCDDVLKLRQLCLAAFREPMDSYPKSTKSYSDECRINFFGSDYVLITFTLGKRMIYTSPLKKG